MADTNDYGLSDIIRQIAFLRGGGMPEGQSTIDKINAISGSFGNLGDTITRDAAARVALQKSKLETEKLKRETTPSVSYTQNLSPEEQANYVNAIRQKMLEKAGLQPTDDTAPQGNPLASPDNSVMNVKAPTTKTTMLTPSEADTMSQMELRRSQAKALGSYAYVNPSTGDVSSTPIPGYVQVQANKAGSEAMKTGRTLITANNNTPEHKAEVAGAVRTAQNEADIQSGTSLNPDAVDLLARRVLAGAQDPMGLGQKIRGPVFNRMAEISKDNGDTVGEQLSRKASLQADTQELTKLQNQRGPLMAFETTAKKNLDNFLGTVSKITDTGSPILNIPLRKLQMQVKGDPNMSAFATAGLVAQNEIAKVLQGGMGNLLTNEARQEAEKALNPAGATLNQIKASSEILMKDLENRRIGFEQQIGETQNRIKNAANSVTPKTNQSPRPGGVLHRDAQGNKAWVYPDGTFDEVK